MCTVLQSRLPTMIATIVGSRRPERRIGDTVHGFRPSPATIRPAPVITIMRALNNSIVDRIRLQLLC